jgi:hypothetical protein
MIFSSSFTTTSFLREDYGLRFHNIIGFFYDATSENIQNSMILKMDWTHPRPWFKACLGDSPPM